MKIDVESFYNYECDCGANFLLAENRINDETIRCPACGKRWSEPRITE